MKTLLDFVIWSGKNVEIEKNVIHFFYLFAMSAADLFPNGQILFLKRPNHTTKMKMSFLIIEAVFKISKIIDIFV